jgi:hypothetical protein
MINNYVELMNYANIVEDMITIYNQSPLFDNPLDFDSE